jgi:uncharacterized membrane protein YgaE (UPF0421/DUF939 family)
MANPQFKIGRFRLGLRTLKTSLAIMLILIIMHVTHRGNNAAMMAGVAAVIALRDSFKATIHASESRFIGAALGGLMATIYSLAYIHSGEQFWVKLVLIPLFVIINIVLMDGFKLHPGLVGANATLLIIALTIPKTGVVLYAVERVIDNFIGVIIAILMNTVLVHDAPLNRKAPVEGEAHD